MTCRAPQATATCAGTPTGNQLSYDAAGRLAAWQDVPGGSPSTRVGELYDGKGRRVEQTVTTNGVTSITVYVGNIEVVAGGAADRPSVLVVEAGQARGPWHVDHYAMMLGRPAIERRRSVACRPAAPSAWGRAGTQR